MFNICHRLCCISWPMLSTFAKMHGLHTHTRERAIKVRPVNYSVSFIFVCVELQCDIFLITAQMKAIKTANYAQSTTKTETTKQIKYRDSKSFTSVGLYTYLCVHSICMLHMQMNSHKNPKMNQMQSYGMNWSEMQQQQQQQQQPPVLL